MLELKDNNAEQEVKAVTNIVTYKGDTFYFIKQRDQLAEYNLYQLEDDLANA